MQEADAGPAALSALAGLVNANPAYLPLGFAYGHLPSAAPALPGLAGKGFAGQAMVEELHARSRLSAKVLLFILCVCVCGGGGWGGWSERCE